MGLLGEKWVRNEFVGESHGERPKSKVGKPTLPGALGRGVEIGVVSFRPADQAITSIPVIMDELALIVAPGHPLAAKETVSVRELGAESFIAHNVASPYRERVVHTFAKHKTPLNISMEMPTLEAIKRLVEREMGVALVGAGH